MKIKRGLLFFLAVIISCSMSRVPVVCAKTGEAAGCALTAEAFVENMSIGWSLGNSLDARASGKRGEDANLEQELNWGNPPVTKELIDYVAASGFDTIRIPVTWYYNSYVSEDGKLCVGEKWLERVQEVVDYAIENDLYVIINSHHDQQILYAGVAQEEMEQVLKNAEDLWKQIAEYFQDYDEHLIFEAYNEIDNLDNSWNYSLVAAAQLNRMNQCFVDTVRESGGNNADRLLMVQTLLGGTDTRILRAFVLPIDSAEDRLIVQVHQYSQKLGQDLEQEFYKLEQFSERIGAPVIIGEFGTTEKYAIPELREEQTSNFVARAAEHGIKCIWWDNGSNYAIINRRDLQKSDTGMLSALQEGTKGITYELPDLQVYDNILNFKYKMPNLTNGELEERNWGTLVTDTESGMIAIEEGTEKCMVSLFRQNRASDIWLQRILFYDREGNYLEGKELQSTEYICAIPEGAAYLRVSLNSPKRSITIEEFEQYLEKGQLLLNISCFCIEDIVEAE